MKKYFHILPIAFCMFICSINPAAGLTDENNPPAEDVSSGQRAFLPSARLALDPFYIYNKGSDFTGIFSTKAEIDLLRHRRYILSTSFKQMPEYSDVNPEHFNFHEIQYVFEYLNLRREFDAGALSAFLDHRCTNYINTNSTDNMITRWYGYGIRWESPGMETGKKCSRKGVQIFSSDSFINYSAAARKSIYTTSYPATWTSDFVLSYDYYLSGSVSAYVLGYAEYFVSDQYTWNRYMEAGLRLSCGAVEFTPYWKYEYITDNRGEKPGTKYHHGAGIRMESALYSSGSGYAQGRSLKIPGFISPEFHFNGSYAHYVKDNKKNFRTNTVFALDLLKFNNASVFFNASLAHSSPKEKSGLYPAYIDTYFEGGLSCLLFNRFFISPFYRYFEYNEGNIIKSSPWDYRLAAIKICTRGMKPGYANINTEESAGSGIKLLNNFELGLYGGYIHDADPGNTGWVMESAARWDIFSLNSLILYLMIGEKSITIENISWTLISECGVRLNRKLALMLYYRNEFNESEDIARDISKIYHLAGVRFDF